MSKHRRIDPAAPTTNHLVLDIETLGTTPGCEIRSIGAAFVTYGIDLSSKSLSQDHFLAHRRSFYRLTDNSTLYRGDWMNPTIKFWESKKVSPRARHHAFTHPDRIPIDEALAHLAKHIASLRQPDRDLMLWGNGPEFDMSILEYAYRATGQSVPWQYWEVRDIRTATSLHPVTLRRRTTKHHALMDAEHEAKMLAMVLNGLRRPLLMMGGSRTSKTEHALDACRLYFPATHPKNETSDHQSER